MNMIYNNIVDTYVQDFTLVLIYIFQQHVISKNFSTKKIQLQTPLPIFFKKSEHFVFIFNVNCNYSNYRIEMLNNKMHIIIIA